MINNTNKTGCDICINNTCHINNYNNFLQGIKLVDPQLIASNINNVCLPSRDRGLLDIFMYSDKITNNPNIVENTLECIKILLINGCNINTVGKTESILGHYDSVLTSAIYYNTNNNIIHYLLANGADPHLILDKSSSVRYISALSSACLSVMHKYEWLRHNNNLQEENIIDIILKTGVVPEKSNLDISNVFLTNNITLITHYLINHAELCYNYRADFLNYNILSFSITNNNPEILELIFNHKNSNGLDFKNLINAKYNLMGSEQTCLFCAVVYKATKSIEVLIKYGADVNLLDKNNKTAYSIACEYKNNTDVQSILLLNGANPNDNPYPYTSKNIIYNFPCIALLYCVEKLSLNPYNLGFDAETIIELVETINSSYNSDNTGPVLVDDIYYLNDEPYFKDEYEEEET